MENFQLPHGLEARLQARARRTGRSIAEVAREAVLDEIEAIEDYYLTAALVRQQRRCPTALRFELHSATTTGTLGARAHISS